MIPSRPKLLLAILLLTDMGAAALDCRDEYIPAYYGSACGPKLRREPWISPEQWDKACRNGKTPIQILQEECRNFYTDELKTAYPHLTLDDWNKACSTLNPNRVTTPTPDDLIVTPCQRAYVHEYYAAYDLQGLEWYDLCRQCMRPGDILAIYKERCYAKFEDPNFCDPSLGIDFPQWKLACKQGFGGKSPRQYIADKRKSIVIDLVLKTDAVGSLSIGDAHDFLQYTTDKDQPPIPAKRKEIERRLAEARKSTANLGENLEASAWNSVALDVAAGRGADQKLNSNFDRSAARLGAGASAVAALARPHPPGGAQDQPPVSLQQPAGNLDKISVPTPGEQKERRLQLSDQIDTLERRKAYDSRTIKLLRDILDTAPEGDEISLEDAGRTIDTLDHKRPKLVWIKKIEAYGKVTLGSANLSLNRIKIASDMSDIKAASTLIHEAGGHLHSPGQNNFINENNAFDMEDRYRSNKLERLKKHLIATNDSAASKDLDALDKDWHLSLFRSAPERNVVDLMGCYYGFGEEIQPNEVVVGDELNAVSARSRAAQARLAKAQDFPLAWLGLLGPAFWNERSARADVETASKQAQQLGEDINLAEDMRARDRKWRLYKAAECLRLLSTKDRRRLAEIEAELAKTDPTKPESYSLWTQAEEIRASVDACQILP